MPRRPVKPQDRQRVARACEPCKASKKRCDGFQPCKTCARKYPHDCHYTAGRRSHPLPRRDSASARMSAASLPQLMSGTYMPSDDLISPGSSWDTHVATADNFGTNFVDNIEERGLEGDLEDTSRGSSAETLAQPPVMLSSTSGDRVFIGNTAAISFLRFLQRTLERYIGPSGFTVDPESRRLFEVDTTGTGSSQFYDQLSLADRKACVRCFLDASSGLLDLYSWEDVSLKLEKHHNSATGTGTRHTQQRDDLEVSSLYLMVATGAQCSDNSSEGLARVAQLFSYARKIAFEHMLENPSLELVRNFLLMSFYMLGACRRNSAFMYLGIASKSADILGLHVGAQYKHLSTSARITRLRTVKSLRAFDVVCNSILGRPSTTPSLRSGFTDYVVSNSDTDRESLYKGLALGATYDITEVLDAAVSKSADDGLDAKIAEEFVLALQHRSRNFPVELRSSEISDLPRSRYTVIGNVHVSGVYYFSVILATRQFLIQHIVPQLSKQDRASGHLGPYRDVGDKVEISQLAEACVEAATFMAEMCHEVMKSGHLLGNMCILKAWTFATGLVLGFSLLADDSHHRPDKHEAFLRSLHVLKHLKRLSPQAEQYYNILSSFHAAIQAYKERTKQSQRSTRGVLVDRIFIPDTCINIDHANEALTTQLPSPVMTTDHFSADWGADMPLDIVGDETVPMDPTLFGENDIIMQMLWDSDKFAMEYPECGLADVQLEVQVGTGP